MLDIEWEVRYGKGKFVLPLFMGLAPISVLFVGLGVKDFLVWQIVIIPFLFGLLWWICIMQGWIKTPDRETTLF